LAPFIGAFLSVVVLGEPIGWVFIVATLFMATGCWLAGR
jgi:drug/metabolite transporter (DMT)-like permease